MIDIDTINARLSRLSDSMKVLRKISELDEEDFLNNRTQLGAAKYYLIESIQICLDISYHIVGVKRWEKPKNYASVFLLLGEKEVISEELADKLAKMAMFRNRLVHLYQDFDNKILFDILQCSLDDIDNFVKCILEYIKNH